MFNFSAQKDTSNDNLSAALRDVSVEITASPVQPSEYTLVLKGFLSPGWIGRLTAGLAQHRISILWGEAEKVSAYAWHATFRLKSAQAATAPLTIDYVWLANNECAKDRARAPIALSDFRIEPGNRHQGSLYLEIKGVDRIGFLGDLLDYFSSRCLFPVKMKVETKGDAAVDKFWLRGVGGSIPSESVASAMRENLDRLVTSEWAAI